MDKEKVSKAKHAMRSLDKKREGTISVTIRLPASLNKKLERECKPRSRADWIKRLLEFYFENGGESKRDHS